MDSENVDKDSSTRDEGELKQPPLGSSSSESHKLPPTTADNTDDINPLPAACSWIKPTIDAGDGQLKKPPPRTVPQEQAPTREEDNDNLHRPGAWSTTGTDSQPAGVGNLKKPPPDSDSSRQNARLYPLPPRDDNNHNSPGAWPSSQSAVDGNLKKPPPSSPDQCARLPEEASSQPAGENSDLKKPPPSRTDGTASLPGAWPSGGPASSQPEELSLAKGFAYLEPAARLPATSSDGVEKVNAKGAGNILSAWNEGVAFVKDLESQQDGSEDPIETKLRNQAIHDNKTGSDIVPLENQQHGIGAHAIPGLDDTVTETTGSSRDGFGSTVPLVAVGPPETTPRNSLYGMNAPVVAELAMDHPSEMLREKEEENQALREQLQRITDSTVTALEIEPFDPSPLDSSYVSARSASASMPASDREDEAPKTVRKINPLLIFLAVIVVVMLVVVAVLLTRGSDDSSTTVETLPPTTTDSMKPVLETIQQNGVIRCRANPLEVDKGEGFTIDLCRALAAAVLKDPSKTQFVGIPFSQQFSAIANGTVDVSTTLNTVNMERDVYQQTSRHAFSYTDPFFYSGTTMSGLPTYVDCVDRADTFTGDCRRLAVCVMANTVTMDVVSKHIPGSSTLLVTNALELIESFVNGTCNVIAGDMLVTNEDRVRKQNYTGEYAYSSRSHWSYDPLAMLTRQSDLQWASFCNWVLRSLITAEYLNITQATASSFPTTSIFGEEYQDMFVQAIQAVGNYGELYAKHYEKIVPRQGMNLLQTGGPNKTGLLVADPLGKILIDESLHQGALPGPVAGGTLEAIRERGFLRCGLTGERAGFLEYDDETGLWSGMDVEFCKAISASILAGEVDTIVYEQFDDIPALKYAALANKSVDVLACGSIRMDVDIKESTTGQGFSFTPPYFYEARTSLRTLVTTDDDPQWSDLVRWVSQSTIYAESMGITQQNASLMPVVELFGAPYRQMFRDAIMATGNYNELYNRTLAKLIPRQGWNRLNPGNGPQMFPFVIGREQGFA